MIPLVLAFTIYTAISESEFVIVCLENNDLYQVIKKNHIKIQRFENPETALKSIKENASIMILAEKYPAETNNISDDFFKEAQKKEIRLYIEYPSYIPNIDVGEPKHTHWERAVVSSDIFGASLPKLRILGINDCHFVPVKSEKSLIAVAKVAGLDSADYGLPQETFPILFEHPDYKILVSTTKLSQFITARYAPTDDWKCIWNMILRWLQPDFQTTELKWAPLVHPSYSKDEVLTDDFEQKAFKRGVEWFIKSHLLVHESWQDEIEKRQRGYEDGVAPLPEAEPQIGDGSYGILEGYSSSIKFDGTQPVRYYLRNDCNGEVSMALAFGDVFLKNSSYGNIASNINDFIRFNSNICLGPRNDPQSPSYGLHGWDTRPEVGGSGNYYGDDNARAILGTIATSALLKTDRWNDSIVRNMIANLRTTGMLGFRQASIIDTDLQKNGWQYFMNQHIIHYAPHYQAYLWAVFIWAYHKTGYKPFLSHAKSAIEMTMMAYPDRWQWTNGIQQERARILLPLAWLIRVEDTPKHREWLRRIAQDMIKSQDSCGAIREELGDLSHGSYPPPRSNEAYGTNEASLISKNGDPISDLLYTTNFAFIGLHEASVSTGEDLFINAENKLTDFLCRIQVDSETHPELDGGWFRAFDYNRWDYWGSNADAGWGAWSIESGWTQGWIASVLAMRQMKTSFWDVTENIDIKQSFDKYREFMLPQDPPILASKPKNHEAVGKNIQLLNKPDSLYPGNGDNGLIDGEMAFADHTDFRWHGFNGDDLEAVIDLGEAILIKSIGINFLQSIVVGIFLPKKVEFAVSEDGQNFHSVASITRSSEDRDTTPSIHIVTEENLNIRGRYIKIHAGNIGIIPDWHSAKGLKAWMFVDEIIVNP